MTVQWIESGFITTNYAWQWSQAIYSDWIRIRHTITTEYLDALRLINERRANRGISDIQLWGKICQGSDNPKQAFQEERMYLDWLRPRIYYFPLPPVLSVNSRQIGIQGQRYYKFNNPNAKWIVHIETPDIPINATLPDFVNPSTPLSASQVQQIASELLLQMKADSRAEPVPINLL